MCMQASGPLHTADAASRKSRMIFAGVLLNLLDCRTTGAKTHHSQRGTQVLPRSACHNVNGTHYMRRCLLLYTTLPFLADLPPTHPNVWQVRELAKCIGECGYDVDVFDFLATDAPISERYDMVVDIHPGPMPFYRNYLTENCIKIAYLASSHSAFRNSSETSRLEGVRRRRGVRLLPRRQLDPINNEWLRSADAMFFKGNQRNLDTYGESRPKRVFFIKNSGYEFLTPMGFTCKRPRSFLFIASNGQVHKGLDLVLESFASRPHLELRAGSGNLDRTIGGVSA
jgi:hypothetical protein